MGWTLDMFDYPLKGDAQATALKVAITPRLRFVLPELTWLESDEQPPELFGDSFYAEFGTHPQISRSRLLENGQESLDYFFDRTAERATVALRRQIINCHLIDWGDSWAGRQRRQFRYCPGWTAKLSVVAANGNIAVGWIVCVVINGGLLRFIDVTEEKFDG